MNPHVQAVQNMCAKGGQGVFKAELRTAEDDTHFGTHILKIVAVLAFSDTSYFC